MQPARNRLSVESLESRNLLAPVNPVSVVDNYDRAHPGAALTPVRVEGENLIIVGSARNNAVNVREAATRDGQVVTITNIITDSHFSKPTEVFQVDLRRWNPLFGNVVYVGGPKTDLFNYIQRPG